MTQRDFSIIVPTYQRRSLVCECVLALDSLETGLDFEIIVVVDGSTDGTASALFALETRHSLIVAEQANAGVGAARNRGVELSSGEFLLFLDDDMTSAANLLDVHYAELTSGADIVLGHFPIDPRSPPGLIRDAVAAWAEERGERLDRDRTIPVTEMLSGQMSISRSLFEELGRFDDGFTAEGRYGNEDLDFCWRAVGRHEVRFVREAISYQRYVVTPEHNIQQAFDSGQADMILIAKFPELEEEIAKSHWPHKRRTRLLFQPISRMPLVVGVVRRLAVAVAGPAYGRSPFTDRLLTRLYANLREIVYWAGAFSRPPH